MLCKNCTKRVDSDGARCAECASMFHFECSISESLYRRRVKTWKCTDCSRPATRGVVASLPTTAESSVSVVSEDAAFDDVAGHASDSAGVIPNVTNAEIYKLLNTIVTEKLSMMHNEITAMRSSLDFISKRYDEVMVELKNTKQEVVQYKREMKLIADTNKKQKEEILHLRNGLHNVEQYTRCRNVELNGLKEQTEENCVQLVVEVARASQLNISEADVEVAHRVPSRNGKGPRPIVAQFKERRIRDLVVKKRRLVITDTKIKGTSIGDVIFLNEHLTPYFKNLLRLAKIRARENRYKYVWFSNNKLLMRKEDGDRVLRIECEEDLDTKILKIDS